MDNVLYVSFSDTAALTQGSEDAILLFCRVHGPLQSHQRMC